MEEIRFISSVENSPGFLIKSNIISDASPPQKTCSSTTNVGTPNTPFSIAFDVLVRNIFLRDFSSKFECSDACFFAIASNFSIPFFYLRDTQNEGQDVGFFCPKPRCLLSMRSDFNKPRANSIAKGSAPYPEIPVKSCA